MSIITMIKSIKKVHKEDIVLLRIGKFYYCYGKDAYIISYFFGYKLNKIEQKVYSCGFPSQSLNKVIAKLENSKINYIILDRRYNYEVELEQNYKNLNTYSKNYEKARKEITIKIRIQNINLYLLENYKTEETKKLIGEIEKLINERRKI